MATPLVLFEMGNDGFDRKRDGMTIEMMGDKKKGQANCPALIVFGVALNVICWRR